MKRKYEMNAKNKKMFVTEFDYLRSCRTYRTEKIINTSVTDNNQKNFTRYGLQIMQELAIVSTTQTRVRHSQALRTLETISELTIFKNLLFWEYFSKGQFFQKKMFNSSNEILCRAIYTTKESETLYGYTFRNATFSPKPISLQLWNFKWNTPLILHIWIS